MCTKQWCTALPKACCTLFLPTAVLARVDGVAVGGGSVAAMLLLVMVLVVVGGGWLILLLLLLLHRVPPK